MSIWNFLYVRWYEQIQTSFWTKFSSRSCNCTSPCNNDWIINCVGDSRIIFGQAVIYISFFMGGTGQCSFLFLASWWKASCRFDQKWKHHIFENLHFQTDGTQAPTKTTTITNYRRPATMKTTMTTVPPKLWPHTHVPFDRSVTGLW